MIVLLYIVSGIALALVAMRWFLLLRARQSKGRKIEGLKGALGSRISSGDRVLAYFYSPSCSACTVQTPVIEKLQRELTNIFKINVASDMATARAFGVMATPTTAIVKRGAIEELLIGAKSEAQIRRYLR